MYDRRTFYRVANSEFITLKFKPVFRICTDPHKDMPPGTGSAWTDVDPDPGGKKA